MTKKQAQPAAQAVQEVEATATDVNAQAQPVGAQDDAPPALTAAEKPAEPAYAYNRVLSVQDYRKHQTRRKQWEIDMALKTLRDLGAAHAEALILGVGAGIEPTLFALTNDVKQVFATDLYADAGMWHGVAPKQMLDNPGVFAPGVTWNPQRLVVQHMDGRDLHYPDAFFDGLFSSGSIEHFGGFEDVAQAAQEIGRVLKPGGIASLSTEFKISGAGPGWAGVLLFSVEDLIKHLVAPSGLTLVGAPQWETDEATLATAYALERIVGGEIPAIEGALTFQQYVFTSVHLALRKD